jgi:hypothetical protein
MIASSVAGDDRRALARKPQPAATLPRKLICLRALVVVSFERFTRLTNGFSKKLENLKAALALYFAWYNFCRIHSALRVTPAMAAGLTDNLWEIEDLL